MLKKGKNLIGVNMKQKYFYLLDTGITVMHVKQTCSDLDVSIYKKLCLFNPFRSGVVRTKNLILRKGVHMENCWVLWLTHVQNIELIVDFIMFQQVYKYHCRGKMKLQKSKYCYRRVEFGVTQLPQESSLYELQLMSDVNCHFLTVMIRTNFGNAYFFS